MLKSIEHRFCFVALKICCVENLLRSETLLGARHFRRVSETSLSNQLQVRVKPELRPGFALLTAKSPAILRPARPLQELGVTPQTYGCGSGSIVVLLQVSSPVGSENRPSRSRRQSRKLGVAKKLLRFLLHRCNGNRFGVFAGDKSGTTRPGRHN